MSYILPISWETKIDPAVLEWAYDLPEEIKQNKGLYEFLKRMASRIYKGSNSDPFYKIIEILAEDKLYYKSLKTIKEYYDIDLIKYFIEKEELCEFYIGYICNDAKQLESALGKRKNKTDKYTLTKLLENIL